MKLNVIEVTPTSKIQHDEKWYTNDTISIFLAGTIDMGNSEDWQYQFVEWLKNVEFDENIWNIKQIVVYNPRRIEGFGPNEILDYQINWELDKITKVNYVIMNFLPNSKSPVTMIEFGLLVGSDIQKLHVICPEDFYRYDNIRVTYNRFSNHNMVRKHMYKNMEEFKKYFFGI